MKKRFNWKKVIFYFGLILIGMLTAFFLIAPGLVEEKNNPVIKRPPYQASERARALHAKLQIVDLHADSLLWNRDLLERGLRGHVDIPRLIEGNVALQAFTVVTKSPRGLNIDNNDDKTDNIFLLALAQRWPLATWRSLTARALFQAAKLDRVAADSGGKFVIIKSSADLTAYLARRESDHNITAGFLGIEGAHALDGDLANIDRLYNAGFRMMAPSHFFDNDIGGSAHGIGKIGLTEKGKEMIRRMEAKHMIVDLAHASSKTIDDALAIATRPRALPHF
jgi:microsomal dipeptidase-like Zn-dependent dipeptidase